MTYKGKEVKRGQLAAFKRVAVGSKFAFDGNCFRKVSGNGAFKLKENGKGETHARVEFKRSTHVLPIY